MDIRNFFGAKPGGAPKPKPKPKAEEKISSPAKKQKREEEQSKKEQPEKKEVVMIDDDDDDEEEIIPRSRKVKAASPVKKQQSPAKKQQSPAKKGNSANPFEVDEEEEEVKAEESDEYVEEEEEVAKPVVAKKAKRAASSGRAEMNASAFFSGAPVPAAMPVVKKKQAAPPAKKLGLEGISFVFSGVMEDMGRTEAEDYVRERGGKVGSSCSSKTHYLVIGPKLEDGRDVEAGRKFRDAEEKEVPTLTGSKEFKDAVDKLAKGEVSEAIVKARASLAKREKKKAADEKKRPVGMMVLEVTKKNTETHALWVDKHKPKSMRDVIGSAEVAKKLGQWLENWEATHLGPKEKRRKPAFAKEQPGAKAALLSGPPGIGKSTMAALVCNERGYEILEMNASDTRSKKSISEGLTDVAECGVFNMKPLKPGEKKKRQRRVIIMDEVDGLSGNSDRGGSSELIKLIKNSSTPIICICNDRSSTKVRGLANSCYDLRLKRPMKATIGRRVAAIARAEGLEIEENAAELLAESCGNDIRQCINALQMWSSSDNKEKATYAAMKTRLNSINKDAMQRVSAFDGARMILSDVKSRSHMERCDAYFIDYSLAPLLLQHNYLNAACNVKTSDSMIKMEKAAAAAECLSDVDLCSERVRSQQYWGLLTTEAALCVRVGVLIDGHCMNPGFPAWFGKNSTTNKCRRLASDLAVHVSQRVSGARDTVRLEYLDLLRRHVSAPLIKNPGAEGVEETIRRLDEYGLSRDDLFEAMPEFLLGDAKKLELDTKSKTAFTKTYNNGVHSSQALCTQVVAKKKKKRARVEGDVEGDDEEDEEEEEETEVDVTKLFKSKKKAKAAPKKALGAKKAPAKKAPAKKKAAAPAKANAASPWG